MKMRGSFVSNVIFFDDFNKFLGGCLKKSSFFDETPLLYGVYSRLILKPSTKTCQVYASKHSKTF